MKFVLLINLKLLSNTFLLKIAGHEILSADKYENANILSMEKSFITSGPESLLGTHVQMYVLLTLRPIRNCTDRKEYSYIKHRRANYLLLLTTYKTVYIYNQYTQAPNVTIEWII